VEFIAVQDQFMTPTAKFADLLLPVCTQLETWGLQDGWKYGDEVIIGTKIEEPPHETKSDYQICAELAERFGVREEFTRKPQREATGLNGPLKDTELPGFLTFPIWKR
jgi:anaerobic dimethyl sulfoxide reductase subunit A